jgi:TPR repeat protein
MELNNYEYALLYKLAENDDVYAMKRLVHYLFDNYNRIDNYTSTPNEKQNLFSFLNSLVEKDDNAAMLTLGALYYTGETEFVEQDYRKAQFWYEKASTGKPLETTDDFNNAISLCNLGYCYYYGRAEAPDYKKAFLCFAKAACYKYGNAMYKIGDMYQKGLYVEQDVNAAFYWYQNAYHYSHNDKYILASSSLRLGKAYLKGEGISASPYKALIFLQKAEKYFYSLASSKNILCNSIFAKDQIQPTQELITQAREKLNAEL